MPRVLTRISTKKTQLPNPMTTLSWSIIAANALSLALGTGISQALQAGTVLLTARQLGAAEFGTYASSFATTSLVAIVFNLGLDNWLLRSGAHDSMRLGTLTGNAIIIKALIGIPWIGMMTLLLPWLNPDTFRISLVFASAVAVWMDGLFSISLTAFKALLQNRITALLLIGSRCIIFLLTILLVETDVQRVTVYSWARMGATAIALLGALLLSPVKPRIDSKSIVRTGKESLPFATSDFLTALYVQADVTILAVFLSKDAVGIYAPASSLINALFVIPSALYSVIMPVLVSLIKTKSPSLKKALGLSSLIFVILGLVLWGSTWWISNGLPIFILGNSFENSGHILSILSPILFLKSCSFAAIAILVAAGWQYRRTWIQAISAAINVAANLIVVRQFGINGTAWVYLLSETVLMIGYTYLVVRWLQTSDCFSARNQKCHQSPL